MPVAFQELGKLYAPFVAQTAQVATPTITPGTCNRMDHWSLDNKDRGYEALLPVFDFSIEEIRDLAFETWGELCRAAREGGE
eukprot:5968138-Amphidinium_carterae.3